MRTTVRTIQDLKAKGQPIVCLTAYDEPSARIAEAAGVDMILVGDSLGNVVQGQGTTLGVTMDQMVYHTGMVASATKNAMIIGDMPFGSYGGSVEQGFANAVRLMKAGAHCIKVEGAYGDLIEACVKGGIPVMGHVGFTPQSVHKFGGFRVQGKGEEGNDVLRDAQLIEQAGAFAIVLELIPAELSQSITEALKIPTIGIGAGVGCSGQVQVFHDILGLSPLKLKHAKRYLEAANLMQDAVTAYAQEVRAGTFPGPENSA